MSRRIAVLGAVRSLELTAVLGVYAMHANAASVYLPWQLTPEIERQIERVMILADRPVLTRPIAAAAVLDALPAACERDAALCASVRHHLRGYMDDIGLDHLSAAAAAASDDAVALPNRHGMNADSAFELAAQAHWQPADNFLVAAGLVAYDGEAVPTGTLVSLGTRHIQLDVGFRDHWLSPMQGSSMLIGTEAQTMPSITLSNHSPITRWGFRYEIFAAEMSATNQIAFGDRFTSGNPRLAGVHLSIEPFRGFAIGVNRILQYGGGERSDSLGDLVDAFLRPSEYDNSPDRTDPNAEFGNQAASITARFLSQGMKPFAVYAEYAGEDTSTNSNFRLGNVSLSIGVDLPRAFREVDLTIELSEWQNGWYEHGIYRDGLRHEGNVIGHWGGDLRATGDAVGARSMMVRAGWQPRFGGWLEGTWRMLDNESYTAPDYERAHLLSLRYSRAWRDFRVGAEVEGGRDPLDRSFARVAVFFRY